MGNESIVLTEKSIFHLFVINNNTDNAFLIPIMKIFIEL